MEADIVVLPGDGIGTEVTAEAVKVLRAVGERYGHQFRFEEAIVGGAAIDRYGVPLPEGVLERCQRSDAVLLGAVGGPKWDDPKAPVRPEQALLALRKGLELFANLRPVKMLPMLVDATTLKPEVVRDVDLMIIRELTGGLYFGEPKRRWKTARGRRAVDTLFYSEQEIERILRVGFETARLRRRKLTSVDKANVLETSRLWREIATELGREYQDVELEHMLVDSASMHLIRRPASFDVLVTENTFGDILSDEASMLAGSMGLLPSASLGPAPKRRQGPARQLGLYEPIHGSAPDIAGQGKANPVASILSAAMLLRYSLGLQVEADAVERAALAMLEAGYRTPDLARPGERAVGTVEMGDAIARVVAAP